MRRGYSPQSAPPECPQLAHRSPVTEPVLASLGTSVIYTEHHGNRHLQLFAYSPVQFGSQEFFCEFLRLWECYLGSIIL